MEILLKIRLSSIHKRITGEKDLFPFFLRKRFNKPRTASLSMIYIAK